MCNDYSATVAINLLERVLAEHSSRTTASFSKFHYTSIITLTLACWQGEGDAKRWKSDCVHSPVRVSCLAIFIAQGYADEKQ
jgi:hypothetical protein